MNIFSRLFKVGQAEAHATINQLEDPIKMTEQGLRDMRAEMEKALQALAEVKAMAIRTRNDLHTAQDRAQDYEQKAILLLKKADSGDLTSQDADRLATEALSKKEQADKEAQRLQSEQEKYGESVKKLDHNVDVLKSNISTWENELRTLQARMKVSSATKSINKQMANIDTSSTVNMLERMKTKVAQEEALAESYGEIAAGSKSVDDEIDKALGTGNDGTSDKLLELKKRLGLPEKNQGDE